MTYKVVTFNYCECLLAVIQERKKKSSTIDNALGSQYFDSRKNGDISRKLKEN